MSLLIRGRRPADDLSRVQADHRRREQPTLVAADVGDIGRPDLVGRLRHQAAVEHVGHHANGAATMTRLAAMPTCAPRARPSSVARRDGGCGVLRLPAGPGDLAIAIHRPAGQPVMLDQTQKPSILLVASAGALAQPRAVVTVCTPRTRHIATLRNSRTCVRIAAYFAFPPWQGPRRIF